MKSNALSEVMIRDHGKIIKFLIEFEKSIHRDRQTTMRAFNNFEWELYKHFFTEEKAIFISYEPEDKSEGYAMIPRLIKEHEEIFKKLKTMKANIKKHKSFDFIELKKMLTNHKDFEDEKVYPTLDQELNDSDKKIIIKRINEIYLDNPS